MKAAFFLPDLNGGGAERAVLLFAASWPVAPRPTVIVRSRSGSFLQLAHDLGVEVVDLGLKRTSVNSTMRTPRRLAVLLRELHVEVVIASLAVQSVVAARAFLPSLRVVWLIQNPIGRLGRAGTDGPVVAMQRAGVVASLRVSSTGLSGIVSPARGLLDALPLYAGVPTAVVPNPVDLRLLSHESAAHSPIPTVVSVGRLVNQKRFDVLVEALAEVSESRSIRARIFGEGPLRAGLRAQIQRCGLTGKVELCGFGEVMSMYDGADCFALASDYEGFGNVLIEALAAGLPVVATDVPFGPREVLDGGRWGTLVPASDPPALAAAIVDALPGGRENARLRKGARRRAQRYHPDVVAQELYLAISSMLA